MRHRSVRPHAIVAFLAGLALSPLLFGSFAARAELDPYPCAPVQAEPAAETSDDAPTPEQAPADTTPTVAETPAARDQTAATATATRPHARFSEIFPDPEGADEQGEFIEIENPDDAEAEISGWSIRGASGKTFVISARLGSKARYAFIYAETKIALVNSGTTLTLLDADGGIADTLTYAGPAKTGKAYARTADGAWRWTSFATPGDENRFDAENAVPTTVTAATGTASIAESSEPVPQPAASSEPAAEPAADAPAAASALQDASVSIVGLLPDPVGDDGAEWIEIRNDGAAATVMTGWKLDDAEGGSGPYRLDDVRAAAGGRVRITRSESKIALNNAGDEARLIGPDGTVRQAVAYEDAPEGETYEFADGAWRWSGAGGRETPASLAETSAGTIAGPEASAFPSAEDAEQPADASIGDLDPDDDALLSVEGVVTLAPGILGKRTFAMQDPAGQGGVIVRAYGTAPFPTLVSGDRVRVVGRPMRGPAAAMSTTGKRVMRLSAGKLDYEERALRDIARDANGTAVAVTGLVTGRSRTSLTLADQTLRHEIVVRRDAKAPIDPGIIAGTTVTARGVVRVKNEGTELVVTLKDGVAAAAAPTHAPTAPAAETGAPKMAVEDDAAPRKPLVLAFAAEKPMAAAATGGIIAAAVAALAVVVIAVRRRRAEDLDRLVADR
ncbi:MAG TPA: lamin tail domain-containing protein [Patescibacteria group bacterium]|nr:lamin tail domain-containing protein [Patescibacteria group bacterium]